MEMTALPLLSWHVPGGSSLFACFHIALVDGLPFCGCLRARVRCARGTSFNTASLSVARGPSSSCGGETAARGALPASGAMFVASGAEGTAGKGSPTARATLTGRGCHPSGVRRVRYFLCCYQLCELPVSPTTAWRSRKDACLSPQVLRRLLCFMVDLRSPLTLLPVR